jgi:RNA polymerase sigma-70 factor (ECF subfamily)
LRQFLSPSQNSIDISAQGLMRASAAVQSLHSPDIEAYTMTNIGRKSTKTGSSPVLPNHSTEAMAADVLQSQPTLSREQHQAEIRACIIQHHSSLSAFARYLTGNQDRANDLVQEAIVRALIGADKFAPGTNFRGWIFTIARNLFYSERRTPFSKHSSLHDMLHEPATQPTQEKHLEFCDFRRAFWELGTEHRTALMQVGVDGMSYQDAASASAVAVGTVKSRVSRARRDLRSLLSEQHLAVPRTAAAPIAAGRLVEALQNASRRGEGRRRPAYASPSVQRGSDRRPLTN